MECVICKEKYPPYGIDYIATNQGVVWNMCPECNKKLDKQVKTGRCDWCGKPVDECICKEEA